MSRPSSRSTPALVAAFLTILASLALAACGSSSSASNTSGVSSSSSAVSTATTRAAGSASSATAAATTAKGTAKGFTGARGRRLGRPVNRLNSAAFKHTLAKFATCLRENGVNIPAPNTSGKGPIFNTRGLNVASPKFKAAELKCASIIRSGLRAAPGAAAG